MEPIKVEVFGGEIPARDSRILPPNNAFEATNVRLQGGSLDGFSVPIAVHTLINPAAQFAYRIPFDVHDLNVGPSTWMEFEDSTVRVFPALVVNDRFERYYWCGLNTPPSYNTLDRIKTGQSEFKLGVPAPTVAPGVVPSATGSGIDEARAYVYTWVTAYEEEGPPSPPTLVTGKNDDTWALTATLPTNTDTAGRTLSKVRFYRTITGSDGVATYFFLVEQDIGTVTYDDTIEDLVLSAQGELESSGWIAPPEDLQGIVNLANGMLVGWKGRDVYFCEPYRPHAWPSAYNLTVDYPIVGIGTWGSAMFVVTTGTPWYGGGNNPASVNLTRIPVSEPCVSRESIVATAQGVYYAGANGVVLATPYTISNATEKLIQRKEWLEEYRPESHRSVLFAGNYFAVQYNPDTAATIPPFGFIVDLDDPTIGVTHIDNLGQMINIFSDDWSGQTLIIINSKVYVWDPHNEPNTMIVPYKWRSKEYSLPYKENLGALKVFTKKRPTGGNQVNSPVLTLPGPDPLPDGVDGVVRVYCDDVLIWEREIAESGELMRLPSEQKSEFWSIEFESRVKITSFQWASSARALRQI